VLSWFGGAGSVPTDDEIKVVAEIITTLQVEQNQAQCKLSAERTRLESRLKSIRNRMDAAYTGKLYLLLFHPPLVHLGFPEVFGDLAAKHRTDETSKQNTSTVAQPA
jgi:hypothetical protein